MKGAAGQAKQPELSGRSPNEKKSSSHSTDALYKTGIHL
jgi:hypothetical protein